MARFTDGERTVEIEIKGWKHGQYTPDCSNDFYEVGGLPFDEVREAYLVDDVDYLIEVAEDYINYRGDFYDEEAKEYDKENGFERHYFVEEVNQ